MYNFGFSSLETIFCSFHCICTMHHQLTVVSFLILDKIQPHIGEHHDDDISLEAFMATGINKIFLGRQPCQDVKALKHCKD